MAKHKWEGFSPPGATLFDADPDENRKCVNCGAVQRLYREHTWGRVTGRYWRPLVGKCKP